jgi:hypothetical protein
VSRHLFLALALLVAALLVACDNESPEELVTGDPIALWRDGPHLRGANVHQRRVIEEVDGQDYFGPGPFGPPLVQEDFDRLSASGANYVQLSHPGVFTEEAPYVLDVDAVESLDRLLQMAAQADLYAVIAFRTGPGRSEFTFFPGEEDTWFPANLVNNDVWTDAAAQQGWAQMWRYTADRYKDAAIVAGYELMVEPNGASTLLDVNEPGQFVSEYADTTYDWGVLYPRILEAVREVDDLTPVIVGGQGWSNARWLPFLPQVDDDRVVLTTHWYEPFDYTHQDFRDAVTRYPGTFDIDFDGTADPFDVPALGGLMAPASETARARGLPLAITEYGVNRWAPGADRFIHDLQLIFEDHGANSAIWQWGTLWPPTRELDSFDFFKGPEEGAVINPQTPLAQAVRDHWAKNDRRPSDFLVDRALGLPEPLEASPASPESP